MSYMYEEDERDRCPGCGMEDVEVYYKGNWWCVDCLLEELYSLDAGVNFVLAKDLEAEVDYSDGMGYKGLFQHIIKEGFDDNDDVKNCVANNLSDFADWMEWNRKKIVPLSEIRNNLYGGNHNDNL